MFGTPTIRDLATPLLGEVPQADGTTSPVSTYSFVGGSDATTNFWIGALRGSATLGALYFTVTCAWDPSNPPGNYPSLPGTLTSNKESTIGVNFEAPTNNGVPILTINNLSIPTAGVSWSSDADPLSPAPALTKVDLVYPSALAGTISITQAGIGSEPVTGAPNDSSDVCFWDSPTGGNLVAFPGQGLNINTATSSLTAVYAEVARRRCDQFKSCIPRHAFRVVDGHRRRRDFGGRFSISRPD